MFNGHQSSPQVCQCMHGQIRGLWIHLLSPTIHVPKIFGWHSPHLATQPWETQPVCRLPQLPNGFHMVHDGILKRTDRLSGSDTLSNLGTELYTQTCTVNQLTHTIHCFYNSAHQFHCKKKVFPTVNNLGSERSVVVWRILTNMPWTLHPTSKTEATLAIWLRKPTSKPGGCTETTCWTRTDHQRMSVPRTIPAWSRHSTHMIRWYPRLSPQIGISWRQRTQHDMWGQDWGGVQASMFRLGLMVKLPQ